MGWLAGWLHALGALLHGHAGAACAPLPAGTPSVAQLVERAELASGGYAVGARDLCRSGHHVLEVTTVAPGRLADARLARRDGTLLDLRWQDAWQRWLHGGEMRAADSRERPSIDLVQALRRVTPYGMVTTARLQYRDARPCWSITVEHAGSAQAWRVETSAGRVRIAGRL